MAEDILVLDEAEDPPPVDEFTIGEEFQVGTVVQVNRDSSSFLLRGENGRIIFCHVSYYGRLHDSMEGSYRGYWPNTGCLPQRDESIRFVDKDCRAYVWLREQEFGESF